MNRDEAKKLLAHCAVFDNRRPSVAAVEGWAAALHDVPMDPDTLGAVARFYGTPPADPNQRRWIEPHHVRTLRAKIREERSAAAGEAMGPGLSTAVPDADPDDVPAYLAALRQQRIRAADEGRSRSRPVRALISRTARQATNPREPYLPAAARAELDAAVPRFAGRYERWPELGVRCPKPDCRARERMPCVRPDGKALRDNTHPSRRAGWATVVAVCPACQVAPGTPCRDDQGRPLPELIHPQREQEAIVTRRTRLPVRSHYVMRDGGQLWRHSNHARRSPA